MADGAEGMGGGALSALLHENRRFEPPPALAAAANAQPGIYDEAAADPLAWWAEQAQQLQWDEPWTEVLDWQVPFAKWFVGGKLNAAVNCVDRHVAAGRGDKVAFHWVGEPEGDRRTITYADLLAMVCRAANALEEIGVEAGDRVAIYMPMIPEAVVAMLACARLGAPHSVVFGGFSAEALSGRIRDADARVVITADGGYRRGTASALKPNVDEALASCPDVRTVIVVRRTGQEVSWTEGRDLWWHELVDPQAPTHEAQSFDAEQPLYIMYTSGTTAQPKGILHTTGGYLVHTSTTHRLVFDLKRDTDVFWTAADIGWVTGHSYIVYGPLANGTTSVMYEGTPDAGGRDRWWRIVEELQGLDPLHGPHDHPDAHEVGRGAPVRPRSLEPAPPRFGGGAHQSRGLDVVPQVRRGRPLPDRRHLVADRDRRAHDLAAAGHHGHQARRRHARASRASRPTWSTTRGCRLATARAATWCSTAPWPGMLRGIWGDPERYRETYWSRFAGQYFAGDGAEARRRRRPVAARAGRRRDEHLGPPHLDHRDRARPGRAPGRRRGGGRRGVGPDHRPGHRGLRDDQGGRRRGARRRRSSPSCASQVATTIGPIAKPRQIILTPELPKTRSGKIMRRLLRDVAEHRELGDVTTLARPDGRQHDRRAHAVRHGGRGGLAAQRVML